MADNVVNDDPPAVEDCAGWYEEMLPRWELAKDLLGGTAAMRAAGEKYLPRFTAESEDNYNRRLGLATLNNFYSAMAKQMVGFVFADFVKIEDCKIPEDILNNIDNQGHDVHGFARLIAKDFITRGLQHILVDMPPRPAGAETAQDDKIHNMRPFWVGLKAECAFNAVSERVAGVDKLQQFRWKDDGARVNGLAVDYVKRIRVLSKKADGVYLEIYEKIEDEEDYILVSSLKLTIAEIPVVTGYAEREGFMKSLSPLEDVAYLNVEHFQSKSDQRNILTVVRYPIPWQIGTANPISNTGPHNVWHSPGNDKETQPVEFGLLEHTGAGVEAGEKDLDRIIAEAQSLGMQLITKAPQQTATGAGIDFADETSPLQDFAQSLEDMLNGALRLTALWLGLSEKDAGYAEVNKDFGISADEAAAINAMLAMRASGDLSRPTLWAEMKERRVFKTGFDEKKEAAALDKEEEDALANMAPPPAPPGQEPPLDGEGDAPPQLAQPPIPRAA
jgi:hypothetical protein